MNTKLNDWAIEVVNYLHGCATDINNPELDLSFYAFQSKPKINPNVVFLGINPGGKPFPYRALYENPVWELEKEGRMTPERFLEPNPLINDLEKWKIWKELQKSFGNFDFFNNYVYMNLIYFNTPNIEDLLKRKNGKEVYKKNIEFTKELLIHIIKPKCIVCLGTKNSFDKLVKQDEILLKDSKRLLVNGKLDDIMVFGIPHPSGSYTSNDNKQKIGELLMNQLE